jgi:ferrous iron transport protein A
MHDAFPLQQLSSGQTACIDQLVGLPEETHRLEELGMRVGTPIEMIQSGPTCIVRLAGTRLAFRGAEAYHVLVRLGENR